ncbi:hypothetical protein BKH46_08415 [Helicobacter sp. 12S02634-8]|uniref:helix-turn-helix domain-containing protein n=1 Tax=Helicobacter sp. 12S02634-8 TaxID=1476199 RepID=UPI000BA7AE4B|nr:helix-turn-helix domain-containing protein [Helicobacter sp. 12S02634-8]PAF46253.1 hypothetical protein BKH46_08415 [Helicobacter sp. 12S02634-8]
MNIKNLQDKIIELRETVDNFKISEDNIEAIELKAIVLNCLLKFEVATYEIKEQKEMLALPEVARMLRISRKKIMEFVDRGDLSAFKLTTKTILIDSNELLAFLESKKIKTKEGITK